ncbi:MAG: TIGR02452 family protein [Eubacterium sp.]|nr:TIGR02452 family protein [Eubacterium sp.]
MSATEEQLIECFYDTVKAFTKYQDLIESTNAMVDSTRVFFENFAVINKTVKRRRTIITVTPDTTFHQAMHFIGSGKKVAVLNFANPLHPGGGVEQGAMSQEECLCRSSNLYAALTCNYVLTNYYDRNSRNSTPYGTDSVVYSKDVTVFKSDDPLPVKLDATFTVDVITCAAPYFNRAAAGAYNYAKYERVFYSRITNILEVAIANDVDVLILGAFGCGVFNNPNELVANVFKHLLVRKGYSHFFKDVVFAVKPDSRNNYEVFKSILDTGHDTINEENRQGE